jgi:predicted RNase H-like HicB family nuclease
MSCHDFVDNQIRREIRKAIQFHLGGLREDGASIPRPSSKAEYVEA